MHDSACSRLRSPPLWALTSPELTDLIHRSVRLVAPVLAGSAGGSGSASYRLEGTRSRQPATKCVTESKGAFRNPQ